MRWLALPLMFVILAGLAYGLWPRGPTPDTTSLDAAAVATALAELDGASGEVSSARAGGGSGPVVFPRDHAAHPDAQGELWELSAILRDAAGEPIAVQLRLARLGLRTGSTARTAPELEARKDAEDAGKDAEMEGIAEANADATKEPEIQKDAAIQVATEAQAVADDSAVSKGEPVAKGVDEPSLAAHIERLEQRESAFATDTIFAGELLLVGPAELDRGAVRAQRVSRAALGLAGAEADETGVQRVWIEQWALSREVDGSWVLRAEADGVDLELEMSPLKSPIVLDQETLAGAPSQPGQASVSFYSQSRLVASGSLRAGAIEQKVHGLAWLDHGWGALSEALAGGQGQLVANRFQLQLDDGSELACLHLRRRAGGGTPVPSCVLVGVDGEQLVLRRRDLTLMPSEGGWVNLAGVEHPLGWQLVIPAHELELNIEPLFDGADSATISRPLADASSSWRGAVRLSGWRGADAIGGSGWMNLNGYR